MRKCLIEYEESIFFNTCERENEEKFPKRHCQFIGAFCLLRLCVEPMVAEVLLSLHASCKNIEILSQRQMHNQSNGSLYSHFSCSLFVSSVRISFGPHAIIFCFSSTMLLLLLPLLLHAYVRTIIHVVI